jgi:hypothetical protein
MLFLRANAALETLRKLSNEINSLRGGS